ncbi:putative DNA topoisomerase 3 [Selenomonas ruminantium subsp. lactilytica TAM6421]|uniref:DNA topoisomerase n=1 Tax=Selenomonas ruminantium subsp. lactilytica (strain NBRC 103574 / TAM6421) TaxID=927704 RepID=I0GQR7_SELRL|nr:DNA topoisomerase 3 [Selenomonas ruminantium]BAL83104.1 putative DNA topoisomerase 3 [Selenomonas ruminantium subsp. lactilytica TAM6421]
MSHRLFIAEKPSLARELAKGLGDGNNKDGYIEVGNDVVTWEYGHLLENYAPEDYDEKYKVWRSEDLPIVPTHWQMKIRRDGAKQVKVIKKLLAETDIVVNGGDPDREGQLLVDELLEYLGNTKPVQRILINALDEKSVKQALADLRDNKDFAGLKESARARSYADWLVGTNLSRAYTIAGRNAGFQDAIRIGRVKTPTMSLVVRREEEIRTHKPVNYYELQIEWQYKDSTILSVWQPDESAIDDNYDLENRLLKQEVAVDIRDKIASAGEAGVVTRREDKVKQELPLLPYSLSALQVAAGKKYGYEPQTVLKAMQELYEKKLTTYPRSDCAYLPENQLADVDEIMENLAGISGLEKYCREANTSLRSRAWNDSKISAHHAIVPTREKADLSQLSDIEQNLYKMVAKAYVAQFYEAYKYNAAKIHIECAGETFVAIGKQVIQQGWKVLYSQEKLEKDVQTGDEEVAEKTLPDISEGESTAFKDGHVLSKVTKPPQRFTPSTLLQAMKEIHKHARDKEAVSKLKSVSGIGTEATRAGIIDSLITSGLLKKEKKYLVPSEMAESMVKFLPDELTWPDMTAEWENSLEEIREGRLTVNEFINGKADTVAACVEASAILHLQPMSESVKCPSCGKVMMRRKGKKGFFWGCSGYPECKQTFPDKKGKPDLEAKAGKKLTGKSWVCPKCGKVLRQIDGANGKFWACEDRQGCGAKFADYKDAPIIMKCTACGEGYMRMVKGKKGTFWSCDRYPECKNIMEDAGGRPKT